MQAGRNRGKEAVEDAIFSSKGPMLDSKPVARAQEIIAKEPELKVPCNSEKASTVLMQNRYRNRSTPNLNSACFALVVSTIWRIAPSECGQRRGRLSCAGGRLYFI